MSSEIINTEGTGGGENSCSERGTIHTLTIVGQIEGHQILPPSAKTTKYEHVMPLLAAIEESDEVNGLLVLLNTVGATLRRGWASRSSSPA